MIRVNYNPYVRNWVGGLLAGIGALGSAAIGAASNSIPRKVRIQNAIADHQAELNRQAWQEQNAYDSPAAQMQRYKEAGLNPNLAYSQLSGSSGTLEAPQLDAGAVMDSKTKGEQLFQGLSDGINAYYNVMSQQQQLTNARVASDLTQTKVDKAKQDIAYNAAANSYKLEDLAIKKQRNQFKRDFSDYVELEKKKQAITESIARVKSMSISDREKSERISNLQKQREIVGLQAKLMSQSLKHAQLQYNFDYETYDARVKSHGLANMLDAAKGTILGYQGKILGYQYNNYPTHLKLQNVRNWYGLQSLSRDYNMSVYDGLIKRYLGKVLDYLPFNAKGAVKNISEGLGSPELSPTSNNFWQSPWVWE